MTGDVHHCHAAGCARPVKPRYFACSWHWFRLHPSIQRAIWREYNKGQEVRKDPTPDYIAVQQCAVAYLARMDGLPFGEAALTAVAYEAQCRERGREPLKGLPRVWES